MTAKKTTRTISTSRFLEVLSHPRLRRLAVAEIGRYDPERIAAILRAHHGVRRRLDLRGLVALVQADDVHIVRGEWDWDVWREGRKMTAMAVPSRDRIKINGARQKEHLLFDLAHELGHFYAPADADERWCNRFAGALLMPRHEIELAWHRARDLPVTSKVVELKRAFPTSWGAQKARLDELGILRSRAYDEAHRARQRDLKKRKDETFREYVSRRLGNEASVRELDCEEEIPDEAIGGDDVPDLGVF